MELAVASFKEAMAMKKKDETNFYGDITFHGHNVYDVYHDTVLPMIQRHFKEDGGEIIDTQECYLGYCADRKVFISGFDCWTEDNDNGEYVNNIIEWRVKDCGTPHIVGTIESGRMFYQDGGYDTLQDQFDDLIDIRLD